MTDAVRHLITDAAWTRVAFNASQAIVFAPPGKRLRGHIGPEAPGEGEGTFHVPAFKIIREIGPLDGLYLRAVSGQTDVLVAAGNVIDGVEFHGETPFRIDLPANFELSLSFDPQVIDGGAPDTDYTGLPVFDGGGATQTQTPWTVDGRIDGERP